jgi:hypothetical protein
MTDRAVLFPERFRAGCAFGAGPGLAGPVSPTGQIEVGIVRLHHQPAKSWIESAIIQAGRNMRFASWHTQGEVFTDHIAK